MSHNLHNCACGCHTAIKLENLSVELNGVKILNDISLHIPRGVCTAIVGPNGAGKSTLAKAIMGFLPHTGSITFGSADGKFTSHHIRTTGFEYNSLRAPQAKWTISHRLNRYVPQW